MEGQLLLSGHGILDYSVREICNIAYYLITKQFPQPQGEDDPSVEEQIELFEERIGQRISSEHKAEQAMRAGLIAMGIDPDAKPELSPELKAKLEEDAMRNSSDEQIMFGGNIDREQRGKKIKDKEF